MYSLFQKEFCFSDLNWIMIFWTVTLQGVSLLLLVSLSKNLIEIQTNPQKSEQREKVFQGAPEEKCNSSFSLHRWISLTVKQYVRGPDLISAEDPPGMNFRSIHHTLCYRDFIVLILIFLVRFWPWHPKWSSTQKSIDEKMLKINRNFIIKGTENEVELI